MGAPGPFDWLAVHFLGAGPAFRCSAERSWASAVAAVGAFAGARRWIAAICVETASSAAAIRWCIGSRVVALDEVTAS